MVSVVSDADSVEAVQEDCRVPGEFRISHAWIQLEGLGEHGSPEYFRSALDQSWVAGAQVTRYTRTWRLSKRTKPGEGLRTGHLGFVEEGELSTLHWVNKTHIWKIVPISIQKNLDQWLATVTGVMTFNARLTYPNPNWTGRENVESLVEGLRAETVTIRAKTHEGSSIDIESDWFRQAMDHIRQGYGKATLTGIDRDTGNQSQFVETIDGGSVPIIDRVRGREESLEATTEDLRQSQDQLIETHSQDMVVIEADEESDL